jgi:hypothetical protein
VDFDILAPRHPHDSSGLKTVQRKLVVFTLKAQGDSLREIEGSNRADKQQDAECPEDGFDR